MRGDAGDDRVYDLDNPGDPDQLFGNGGSDILATNDGDTLDALNGGPDSDACHSDAGDTETSCETE